MEQGYKYIKLETQEVKYDQISIRILEDGTRYIRLNDKVTKYLHDHQLAWVKLKVGESDKTVFLEFVENKDEYTAPIKDNSLVMLPSIIDNDVAETYIISLFDDVEDGYKINISDNLTPWVAPVPVHKEVAFQATLGQPDANGNYCGIFPNIDDCYGYKVKITQAASTTAVTYQKAEFEIEDEEGIRTVYLEPGEETEIEFAEDTIAVAITNFWQKPDYKIEWDVTPAPDPCVATYQIYYSEDKHI